MKYEKTALFVLCCAFTAITLSGFTLNAGERPYKAATLRLSFDDDGFCSGTAVGTRTVLTATHCLNGGELQAINGQAVTVTHVEEDGKDHTLLWVDMEFPRPAKIAGKLEQGDEIEFWGNPANIPDQYRKGVVSGPVMDAVLLDINGWKGDSGAGVFKDGKVVTSITGIYQRDSFGLMITFPLAFTEGQLALIK